MPAAREEGIRLVVVERAFFPMQPATFAYLNPDFGAINRENVSTGYEAGLERS